MVNSGERDRQIPLERGIVLPIRVGLIGGEYGFPGTGNIRKSIRTAIAREGFKGISVVTYEFSGPIMQLDEKGEIPQTLKPSLGLLDAAADSVACDILVLTAHSAHLFQKDVEAISGRKVVSLIDLALEEAVRRRDENNLRKVGVIGYSSTRLIRSLYEDALRERGMEFVTIPDTMSQALDLAIDNFVAQKLPLYRFADVAWEACEILLERDAQAIIFACSELPLGLTFLDEKTREVVINPNELAAEAVVAKIREIMQKNGSSPYRIRTGDLLAENQTS